MKNQDFREIKKCRMCENKNLLKIIDFKKQPLANDFKSNKDIKFPLKINHCRECQHNQLSISVNPNILFKKYYYMSSFSKSYQEHNFKLAKKLMSKFKLSNKDKIIDIGSNDGILLSAFNRLNLNSIGVEPSKNLSKVANEKKLKTFNFFFSKTNAKKYFKDTKTFKLITANNVFAHIDNFDDFLEGINEIISLDGYFVFEVSYFKDVIKKILFDTVYHEHIDYHLIHPLIKKLDKYHLYVFDIDHIDTHGGSIRIYCSKKRKKRTNILISSLKKEKYFLNNFNKNIDRFNQKITKMNSEILDILNDYRHKKFQLFCYGASAKATMFINIFNIQKFLSLCFDDSSTKIGGFIPGTKIKIVNSNFLKDLNESLLVISAWNFSSEIISRIKKRIPKMHILVPLPKKKLIKN